MWPTHYNDKLSVTRYYTLFHQLLAPESWMSWCKTNTSTRLTYSYYSPETESDVTPRFFLSCHKAANTLLTRGQCHYCTVHSPTLTQHISVQTVITATSSLALTELDLPFQWWTYKRQVRYSVLSSLFFANKKEGRDKRLMSKISQSMYFDDRLKMELAIITMDVLLSTLHKKM